MLKILGVAGSGGRVGSGNWVLGWWVGWLCGCVVGCRIGCCVVGASDRLMFSVFFIQFFVYCCSLISS